MYEIKKKHRIMTKVIEALFKIRAGAFYKVKNHEEQPSGFKLDKTRVARFFLEGLA